MNIDCNPWIIPCGKRIWLKWVVGRFRLTPKNGKSFEINYSQPAIIQSSEISNKPDWNKINVDELKQKRLDMAIKKYQRMITKLRTERMGIRGHRGRFRFIKVEEID